MFGWPPNLAFCLDGSGLIWSQAPTSSAEFLSPSDVSPSPPPVLPYQRRYSSFSPAGATPPSLPPTFFLLPRWRSFSRPCSSSSSHRRHHYEGARGIVDHDQDEDVFRDTPVLLCDAVLLRLLLDLTWCHRAKWCAMVPPAMSLDMKT